MGIRPRLSGTARSRVGAVLVMTPTKSRDSISNAAFGRRITVIAARVAKLQVRAPTDGTVALIVAEPGEAIIPGQPVMTFEPAGANWTSFNLREDQFDDLRIGSRVERLPANGNGRIEARIAEIIPRGEFAAWRAARVVGDHDLNTFLHHF